MKFAILKLNSITISKMFLRNVLVLDNFFLSISSAPPCSSLLRRKRGSTHPFIARFSLVSQSPSVSAGGTASGICCLTQTAFQKSFSRISMVSCMNNYVGTINNNCVGSMALVTWLPSFLLKNDLELYPSRLIYCQQQETAQ